MAAPFASDCAEIKFPEFRPGCRATARPSTGPRRDLQTPDEIARYAAAAAEWAESEKRYAEELQRSRDAYEAEKAAWLVAKAAAIAAGKPVPVPVLSLDADPIARRRSKFMR